MARSTSDGVIRTNFMKNAYQKVDDSQLKFFIQHKDEFLSEETFGTSVDIYRKKLAGMVIRNERCNSLAREIDERNMRLEKQRDELKEVTKEVTPSQLDILGMRPASPKTLRTLYEGISHDKEGRYKYLKLRNIKAPEDKFQVRYPRSWDFGWNLGETIKKDEVKKSIYGRISILENAFFSAGGIPRTQDFSPSKKVWYG